MRVVIFGRLPASAEVAEMLFKYGFTVTAAVIDIEENKHLESALAEWAVDKGIRVISFAEIGTKLNLEPPSDLGVSAGFSRRLPVQVLQQFRYGILNFHPALLPGYGGVFTDVHVILNEETQSGVTVHWMTSELDKGPIVAQLEYPIFPSDTVLDVFTRGQEKTVELARKIMPKLTDPENLLRTAETQVDEQTQYFDSKSIDGKKDLGSLTEIGVSDHDASYLQKYVRAFDHPRHVPAYISISGVRVYLRTRPFSDR